MKILVVGREGQLARSLLEAAVRPDIQVVSIGRPEIDVADEKSVVAAFARERRLPTMTDVRAVFQAGMLLTYSPSPAVLARQAAGILARIGQPLLIGLDQRPSVVVGLLGGSKVARDLGIARLQGGGNARHRDGRHQRVEHGVREGHREAARPGRHRCRCCRRSC